MKRFFLIAAGAAAGFVAELAPAQAQFISLGGRFECLESEAAVCGDAQPVAQPRPVPPLAAAQPLPAEPIATATVAAPIPAVRTVTAPAPVAAPAIDPLTVVATRIQARRLASNDLVWLAQAAREGNARAIELLAWCKLNGIGMARDPVEAFLLYGAADSAALPNARENQRLIFERDLDSPQRQQVLDLANEGVMLARLTPGAR